MLHVFDPLCPFLEVDLLSGSARSLADHGWSLVLAALVPLSPFVVDLISVTAVFGDHMPYYFVDLTSAWMAVCCWGLAISISSS